MKTDDKSKKDLGHFMVKYQKVFTFLLFIGLMMSMLMVFGCSGDESEKMIFVEGGAYNEDISVSSFYISKYELTQKEWKAVMEQNPSKFKGDKRPVEQVSWYDAVIFCNKLSEKEGLTPVYYSDGNDVICDWSADGYRLPTVTEWRYAAKGGNKSNKYLYSGSKNVDDVAWYDSNSGKKTHNVGTKAANELGIFDMSGNVYEWCWDWSDIDWDNIVLDVMADPNYDSSHKYDPKGPDSGTNRISCGGAWSNGKESCVTFISHKEQAPSFSRHFLGFRVVRNATSS